MCVRGCNDPGADLEGSTRARTPPPPPPFCDREKRKGKGKEGRKRKRKRMKRKKKEEKERKEERRRKRRISRNCPEARLLAYRWCRRYVPMSTVSTDGRYQQSI